MTIAGRFKVLSYSLGLRIRCAEIYIVNFSVDILCVSGDDNTSTSSRRDEDDMSSSVYRLEIVGIELLSLYGTEVCSYLQTQCFIFIFSHGVTVR